MRVETNFDLYILQERLRQARLSFNLALGLIAISTTISIFGIGLLLKGQISQVTATTAGGLAANVVSVCVLKLTRDANDRLDKMAKELMDKE
ncbi:hypothetical protein H6S82_05655 [Planktothrix sp. FACHB-1355]|uniref:Cyanobacterial TRADD-N associated 2 transmembrane domain-containing protein n=1 Tax=Aerosakkonema funiforme FACHB-1375 TaxID=2949571 RepID=A0A926VAV6_9CYAN|nr:MULTISPECIES: hypothetical protein [Oscillatoriales]MBD2180150.1 hypothetical protein [Aerosakkonema funiforme FACHB-1375]MBD3558342.1 hypothetical protein [Planktothrix sp. FACHB-1355]